MKKYRVIGPNTADHRISTWYYDELDGPLGANLLGIQPGKVSWRLAKGWSIERALTP